MEKTEQKYINMALADLLKDYYDFVRLVKTPKITPRQKAIYTACMEQAAIVYNRTSRMIGRLGSSAEASAPTPLRPLRADSLTAEDVDEILNQVYKVHHDEILEERQRINKELEVVEVIGSAFPKKVKDLLQGLVQTGAFSKLIDVEKLLQLSPKDLPTEAMPRGNPMLGGLTKKYREQGCDVPTARRYALEEYERRKTQQDAAKLAEITVEEPKAIMPDTSNITVEEAWALRATAPVKKSTALDLIDPSKITEDPDKTLESENLAGFDEEDPFVTK